jgi:hypothetical protein
VVGPGHHVDDEITRALVEWRPRGDFGIDLRLMVGDASANETATDVFELTLCTPGWLTNHVREVGIVDGRHLLICREYDYHLIERYLRERIEKIEGESWPEVAMKIDEIAEWEWKPYPD